MPPTHVFLSAHSDDAVYSCGALIHRLATQGEKVSMLTVFAGDPPTGNLTEFARALHLRWDVGEQPVAVRRREDLEAGRRLGCGVIQLDWPEALYRVDPSGQALYPSEKAIFASSRQDDPAFAGRLAEDLEAALPKEAWLYVPLGLGGHVDHCAVRRAAESSDRTRLYYRDFPYVTRGGTLAAGWEIPAGEEWDFQPGPEDLAAWAKAAMCYGSQMSTFWSDAGELSMEIRANLGPRGELGLIVPFGLARPSAGVWAIPD